MHRLVLTAALLSLSTAPAFAQCRAIDFGRYPLDSVLDSRLPVAALCRAQGECEFVGKDGVRYLAEPFEFKAAPRIVRKTIDTSWSAAPFGLRPGDSLETVRAKLKRAGFAATAGRAHDGRPVISVLCTMQGGDIHLAALFTPGGALASLEAGILTPTM